MAGRRLCTGCGASYHIEHKKPIKENICDKCGEPLYIRSDDSAETVKNRLDVFHEQTEPLKSFYDERGLLKCVSSEASVEETAALVFEALSEVGK
jgi:adenylate kinase